MPMASTAVSNTVTCDCDGNKAAVHNNAEISSIKGKARRPPQRAKTTPSAFPATNASTAKPRRKITCVSPWAMPTASRVVLPLINEMKSPTARKPMASVIPASTDKQATNVKPTRLRKARTRTNGEVFDVSNGPRDIHYSPFRNRCGLNICSKALYGSYPHENSVLIVGLSEPSLKKASNNHHSQGAEARAALTGNRQVIRQATRLALYIIALQYPT